MKLICVNFIANNFLILGFVCTLSLGCTNASRTPTTPLASDWKTLDEKQLTPQELAVVETVFWHKMPDLMWAKMHSMSGCYLRIGRKDPSAEFLTRFSSFSLPVRPASKAKMKEGAIVDSITENPAIIRSVDKIRWITETRVEVRTSYITGNLSGGGVILVLEFREGKWVVLKSEDDFIS
jgi:hypothetical protein